MRGQSRLHGDAGLPAEGFRRAVNHLLRDAPWARDKLRTHAGRCARIDCGPLQLPFAVDGAGLLVAASGGHPDLVLELPASALGRLGDGWEAVMRAATMRGNVEFAETIGFVFRNLRWDVEEDLSRLTGDVAARRLVRAGSSLAGAVADAGRRLGDNLADYLRHEAAIAVPAAAVADFCRAVDDLRDAEQRLEARLRRLENAR